MNGLFAGGLVAFGCVLALTKIDQRAFSEEEIAEAAGTAITAEIPPIGELADPDYVATVESQPPLMREAMRSLAAALDLSRDGEINHKVILFSSSTPNEGKSTLALHFALYLAKSGFKTLLIDGDLRRGCIGETLGLDPAQPGLSEGLAAGASGWRRGIHRLPGSKLSVLPRGNTSGETFDLLPRGLSRELFFDLKTDYDAIVVDSSPLIPVSDSIAFLQYADHVLLISRMKVTKLDMLKKTAALVRKSAPNGFRLVANELKGDPRMYGYGYHENELAELAGRRGGARAPAA
jgi:capsular exopolysaccharide synthesis family protein